MSIRRKHRREAERGKSNRGVEGVVVTYRPLREEWYVVLPADAKRAIIDLHSLCQDDPAEAVPRLIEWISAYPHVPVFYNYLANAYMALGETELSAAVTATNLERNPDYLFARVNEALASLEENDLDGFHRMIPALTLREMYPRRTVFHVSEFAAFMAAVARYRMRTGDMDEARRIWSVLQEVAPEDATTAALGRRFLALLAWEFRRAARRAPSGAQDGPVGGAGDAHPRP